MSGNQIFRVKNSTYGSVPITPQISSNLQTPPSSSEACLMSPPNSSEMKGEISEGVLVDCSGIFDMCVIHVTLRHFT